LFTQSQKIEISNLEKKLTNSHKKVIEVIRRERKATRAKIAKEIGLSTQSLTRLTKELIELGILIEHSKVEGQRGQPGIYLTLRSEVFVCIGVVFEHDRVTVVLDDFNKHRIEKIDRSGIFLSATKASQAAIEILDEIFTKIPSNSHVLGIGIAVSGFFTNKEGQICSQQDPLGWSNIDFQALFGLRYECQCFLENDASAASIGFSLTKTGSNLQSFFLLLLTLDIGGGFVVDGKLVDGAYGNAGEITALFGGPSTQPKPTIGSLLNYLSQTYDRDFTISEIEDLVVSDDYAVGSWTIACVESLKYPLKAIQSLLDPQKIVLAGRLPIKLQRDLADKITISTPSCGGFSAPAPEILVSDIENILEIGVTSIPAFYFFNR